MAKYVTKQRKRLLEYLSAHTDEQITVRQIADALAAGDKEIYVEYVVVDPIKVEIYVDSKLVATKICKGEIGEKPDYKQALLGIKMAIMQNGVDCNSAITCDGEKEAFGFCTKVTVEITTETGNYEFNPGGITATIDDIKWATGSSES